MRARGRARGKTGPLFAIYGSRPGKGGATAYAVLRAFTGSAVVVGGEGGDGGGEAFDSLEGLGRSLLRAGREVGADRLVLVSRERWNEAVERSADKDGLMERLSSMEGVPCAEGRPAGPGRRLLTRIRRRL